MVASVLCMFVCWPNVLYCCFDGVNVVVLLRFVLFWVWIHHVLELDYIFCVVFDFVVVFLTKL